MGRTPRSFFPKGKRLWVSTPTRASLRLCGVPVSCVDQGAECSGKAVEGRMPLHRGVQDVCSMCGVCAAGCNGSGHQLGQAQKCTLMCMLTGAPVQIRFPAELIQKGHAMFQQAEQEGHLLLANMALALPPSQGNSQAARAQPYATFWINKQNDVASSFDAAQCNSQRQGGPPCVPYVV